MRISNCSSDVCSSDLCARANAVPPEKTSRAPSRAAPCSAASALTTAMSFTTRFGFGRPSRLVIPSMSAVFDGSTRIFLSIERLLHVAHAPERSEVDWPNVSFYARGASPTILSGSGIPLIQIHSVHIDFSRKRSDDHTYELQS